MNKHLAIVTGHSRGLGAAVADQLHAQGWQVLGISRKPRAAPFEEWAADLADPLPVAERLQAWLAERQPARLLLINNAALVTDPGPVAGVPLAALSASLRVGLEAVVLLSGAVLAGAARCPDLRIVNVSSGLGRRPMAAAAPYCAVKAGMDMFSRALQLEGVRVTSLAPGIIDTDMQVQLRSGDPSRFPDVARFVDFKASGALQSAEDTARRLIDFALRPDFDREPLSDLRQV
ncbi:MAG: SDR family NAD(P)-dependent oxidoreductase [Burkholderiales bacterium]|nr:SDR family NAD(P)-dependent oxidoreductase [Burkholderiales bacterium]